ncbi:MAG: LysR substrate-binding domain-containing protein [Pseudomonadota bacterium]
MNLRQLEYFVRVAEAGSFSKAAMILGIAQPALSRQVRLLEAGLRATLLLRTGRGVVLTEAGKRLLEHGVRILQRVAQARHDMDAARNEPAGHIVVALPPTVARTLTLPLVERFRRELPRARLAVVEGFSTHIAEWVATGRVDVGAVYDPGQQPALETSPVRDEALCLISPAAAKGRPGGGRGPRTMPAPVRFADLPRYPLIVPERAHAFRRLLEEQASRSGLKLAVAWEMSSVHSILELVRAGHGHAVLTESALAASGRARDYMARPLVAPRLAATLCLAVSAHKPVTPLRRHTMRLLRELLLARGRGGAAPAPAGYNDLR